MPQNKIDFTRTIISTEEIKQRIGLLFPDSVILDRRLVFVSVSRNVADVTGYSSAELVGKSVSVFSAGVDLAILMKEFLQTGYFEAQPIEVLCKDGGTVQFIVSGFYLGLIAEINDLIFIKFTLKEDRYQIFKELAAKTQELDDFVYTSAHSLRGPLATMKGLIHLSKSTADLKEISFLVNQLDIFAQKLDDKLHKLIYFAESDKNLDESDELWSVQFVSDSLNETISEASIDFPVQYQCLVEDMNQPFDHGKLILSISKNIILFFCQQAKIADNKLLFDAQFSSCATEIMIRSKGFQLTDALIEKIMEVNFGYSEILKFPELVNYYAAKKMMAKLNGTIQFMHVANDEMVVLMTIPRLNQLTLF